MNVSLTPELEQFVRNKVKGGLYNNASEVIREGLRVLKEHDEVRLRWRSRSSAAGCRHRPVNSSMVPKRWPGSRTV